MRDRGPPRYSAEEAERKWPGVTKGLGTPKAEAAASKWSAAKPTDVTWTDGTIIRCRSKTEAMVAARLVAEVAVSGATLYREVSFPLLSIEPRDRGKPLRVTLDFVVREKSGEWRAVEAKCKGRRSRDWPLRKAAAERWLGCRITECDA